MLDDFNNGLDHHWQERKFQGRTTYIVKHEDGRACLEAVSSNSASGLIYKIDYNPGKYPIFTWKWKVENIIAKGDAATKEGDDYAARIYIAFPTFFRWNTRMINYIWANKLPKDTATFSTFMGRDIMIAIQSGTEHLGKWVTEERNVYEDYKRYFGVEPPNVGAIAIMTDTDQTGETAKACYGRIRIRSAAQ